MTKTLLSRRTFIRASAAAGGGLMIAFYLPDAEAARIEAKPWTAPPQGTEINAWLAIGSDGTVTIRVPHTEMGQGGLTSVAMLVAEELDVSMKQMEYANPETWLNATGGGGGSGGSIVVSGAQITVDGSLSATGGPGGQGAIGGGGGGGGLIAVIVPTQSFSLAAFDVSGGAGGSSAPGGRGSPGQKGLLVSLPR